MIWEISKKILASPFWDAEAILFVDYFQTGNRINLDYNCKISAPLDANIDKKDQVYRRKQYFFIKTRHSLIQLKNHRENQ